MDTRQRRIINSIQLQLLDLLSKSIAFSETILYSLIRYYHEHIIVQ